MSSWTLTYMLELGRRVCRSVHVLHDSDKLTLLRVTHGEDPFRVRRGGALVESVPVVQVVVAVVRHEHPVSLSTPRLQHHHHDTTTAERQQAGHIN